MKKQTPTTVPDDVKLASFRNDSGVRYVALKHAAELLLERLDPDPTREGLRETPARVAKAWMDWTQGYQQDPARVMKVFTDGASNYDEMVYEANLPFYSHCEHHLAPFFGTATIAYVPDGKRIVGLSKLGRLLDIYARRLQVQERMTVQIANTLQELLKPKGVGVFITARHFCVESRGVCKAGAVTHTSALRGVMKTDPASKQEFLSIAHQYLKP